MQVTSVADHVSHAVINAGETMEFSVSDDPMFFQMLSSTLYTRQTEAMVRETLCNAWDAHIDAGLADTPIEISLDNDYLTIRDYGKGIPHDMIRPIYLIYGKSTKANSSNQTGGFGLGCKAPFAYSDHFEVRSYHDGKCTIYNMSKASLEHDGRPAASVVACIPTTETGLQVRVPLNNTNTADSYREIHELVKHLVMLGGMKATLSCRGSEAEELPVINLDTKPGSFLLSQKIYHMSKTSHKIYVRYGSVVYPVENAEGYNNEYQDLLNNLRVVSNMDHVGIVFQAGPDTICIPPSRESLSITPLTEATVKELLSGYLKDFDNAYYERSRKVVLDRFAAIVADPAEKGYALLKNDVYGYLGLRYRGSRHGYSHSSMDLNTEITSQSQALDQAVMSGMPSVHQFTEMVEKERFDTIVAKKLIPNHWLKGIRNIALGSNRSNLDYREFLVREVFAPILAKIDNHPDLDTKQFGVLGYPINSWSNTLSVVSLDKLQSMNQERALLYARGVILLSYTKKAAVEQLYCGPAVDGIPGAKDNVMVYTVPRTKGTVDKVRQAFAAMRGYQVIDLTLDQDVEKAARDKAARAKNGGKAPSAKKVGFQAASGAFRADDKGKPMYDSYPDFSSMRDVRIENPKWVEMRPTKSKIGNSHSLSTFLTGSETRTLMSHIGDVGALAISEAQYKKLSEDKKLPGAMDYALQVYDNWQQLNKERLMSIDSLAWATLMTNKEIKEMVYKSKHENMRIRQIFHVLRDHAETAEYFGLTQKDRSKPTDEIMEGLYKLLYNNSNRIPNQKAWKRVEKEFEQIKQSVVHNNARKVIATITGCSVIGFLEYAHIAEDLESKFKEKRKAAAAFLIKTLNTYRG